jgi:hypothetical protein
MGAFALRRPLIVCGHHGPHPPNEEGSEPHEEVESDPHIRQDEVGERCEDG